MSAYIPSFRSKDPGAVEPKNFAAEGKLLQLGNPTVVDCDVLVDPVLGCADGALVITAIAYDPVTKRVSFTWSGGTLGERYCLTCWLTFGPGWSIPQSAYVTIARH